MSGFNAGAIDPALLSGGPNNPLLNFNQQQTTTNITSATNTNTNTNDSNLLNNNNNNLDSIGRTINQNQNIIQQQQQPQSTSSQSNYLNSSINNNNLSSSSSSHLSQSLNSISNPHLNQLSSNHNNNNNNNYGLNQQQSTNSSSSPSLNSNLPRSRLLAPSNLNFSNGTAAAAPPPPLNQNNNNNNDPFLLNNGLPNKEHEMHQKDQELAQFLLKMEEYKPIIPDEVAKYYLTKVGFECNDIRVQRLLVLSCQKFISDISQDAFSYARTRTGQAPGGRQGPLAPNSNSAALANNNNGLSSNNNNPAARKDRTRTVLTQEDLAQALAEYGINASRAPYYL